MVIFLGCLAQSIFPIVSANALVCSYVYDRTTGTKICKPVFPDVFT